MASAVVEAAAVADDVAAGVASPCVAWHPERASTPTAAIAAIRPTPSSSIRFPLVLTTLTRRCVYLHSM
ncbi:hypothetical protein ACFPRL_29480 [Pseudoclavibacter helvolus]